MKMSRWIVRAVGFLLLGASALPGAEPPPVEWERTFGGEGDERSGAPQSVEQTADGGFIVVGSTTSFGNGKDDVYLVKTNPAGNQEWCRTFGDSELDYGQSVQQTRDGGYIVAGWYHPLDAGSSWDAYLIKTDPEGKEIWSQTFYADTRLMCAANAVLETDDGKHYVFSGLKSSIDSGQDFALVKTDLEGIEGWSRTYGGPSDQGAVSLRQTLDGGFVMVGDSTVPEPIEVQAYLVKVDTKGVLEWQRSFGDGIVNYGRAVCPTADGGYVFTGGTDLSAEKGGDVYLVKTDGRGDDLWSRKIDAGGREIGLSVQQTSEGGYIVAGRTRPLDQTDSGQALILKTDEDGHVLWSLTFGGDGGDEALSVVQTRDGGYIIAGSTSSFGAGGSDLWLIKLAPESQPAAFLRGRTDGDDALDISDAICLLGYLFDPGPTSCKETVPSCLDAADANDDGRVNITDGILVLLHLFSGAGGLPPPFESCGIDGTADDLGCDAFKTCN